MRRRALLLAIAGCSSTDRKPEPPPPAWVYAPAPLGVMGPPIGRIGRSQAPQLPRVLGIEGTLKTPLRVATPWRVPGDGPARAILDGRDGERSAIELVDVDAGRVLWRDPTACAGPVVGVTATAVVCADSNGVRGVGMDGKAKWKAEAAYLAMTDDRVVTAGPGEAIVIDAGSGDELAHVKMPSGVMADAVVASCGDAGRELFAVGQDGKLVRIAEGKGGPTIAWTTPIGRIDEIDACTGTTVLVREAGVDGGALVAIDRANGKVTGRVTGVHGFWKARVGDGIEIATARGVQRWARDLVDPPVIVSSLAVGELLAERADRRLVRTSAASAVVLDKDGVRAYLPFAALGAVMGDAAIIGASWQGTAETTVWRIGLPARYRKNLRVPTLHGGLALPAELRDLPTATVADAAAAIARAGAGMHAVLDVAIDPTDSAVLYTLQLEKPDDDAGTPTVASIDLATRAWRWLRADACGIGASTGLAVARDVVVCATRTRASALVRATRRDGAAAWDWKTAHVDHVEAAGGVVLAFDGERVTVLDAATGTPRWQLASDDGGRARVAAVAAGAMTYVIAYERGRLVARLAGGLPVWSIAVDGIVTAVSASGAGVLVTLEDGDAFRVALDGVADALPGFDLDWRAAGDVIAASTAGGPIPGSPEPTEPLRVLQPVVKKKKATSPPLGDDVTSPRLWTPIPPPAPLGESWQLTIYELAGGLRVRNDYGLFSPVVLGRGRGPGESPIVVAASETLRVVLVIDPRTGDPQRRIVLGEDAAPGLVFGTIVDGAPVAGAVLQQPLRVVLF